MSPIRRHSLKIIIVAYLVLGGLYSAAVPLFEAPDERQHYGYVHHLASKHRLPPRGEASLAEHEASQPPLYYAAAALSTVWRSDGDFVDLEPNRYYGNYQAPGTVNDNKNVFLHTELEDFPWRDAVLTVHIARIINLLFGGLTVGATYLLAREVFPKVDALASCAAAMVAFTPQFLFISSAVNNDIAASGFSTLALWLLVGGMRQRYSLRRSALLGVALGLATLSKVSALALLPLILLAMGLRVWSKAPEIEGSKRLRLLVARWAVVLGVALAVSGWWFVRNGFLYQDPLGLQTHFDAWWRYEEPLPLRRLWSQLPGVALTFWAAFGMGNIHPPMAFYAFAALLAALAMIGLGIWTIRSWQSGKRPGLRAWSLVLLAAWFAVVFAALLRWMQLVQAPLGRLLFPAVGAVAILMTWGLAQLVSNVLRLFTAPSYLQPVVLRSVLIGLVVTIFCLATAIPFLIIRPAYARPPLLSMHDIAARSRPADTQFGDSVRLVGYQLSDRSARPGEEISVRLCWEALARTEKEYAYFIHFLGESESIIGSRDTYPGLGRFPTSQWTPGDAFCDVARVPVQEDAPTQVVYDVEIGWYEPQAGKRLPALDADRDPIDLAILGRIKVVPKTPPTVTIPHSIGANLGDRVTLLGYHLSPSEGVQESRSLAVTLYWKAEAAMDDDYTVFVHLAPASAPPSVQDDSQPRNGSYPTSFWEAGEVVVDRHVLEIPEGLPSGEYQLLAGMYRLETEERLSWLAPDGTVSGDAVPLETIVIQSDL